MNKTELYNTLMEILNNHKAKPALIAEIEALVKPKVGGGIAFAPIEKDGVTYHRCRYTELYLPESELVMSSGKSKGYSKIAISRWTKAGKDAKVLQESALKELLAGNIVEGQDFNAQAEELLLLRNKPEFYQDLVESIQDDEVVL